jgi:hypothetical protein
MRKVYEHKIVLDDGCNSWGIRYWAFVGSIAMMTTPAVAQNMTGDNAMMAGNMTSSNTTGGNWTK